MARTTIRHRLITRFGSLFFIAFLLVLLLSRFVLQVFYARELQADFEEEMSIISSVFKEEFRENISERSIAEVLESVRLSKRRLDLFQLDSNIEFLTIANGNPRFLTGQEDFSNDLVGEISGLIMEGDINKVITLNSGDEYAMKVYISPVEKGVKNQKSNLYAVIYIPVANETELLGTFTSILLVILASVYFAVMIFVYVIANRISKPIRRLEAYAISLGKMTSNKPVKIKTNDEIEALAGAMNHMAEEVAQFQEEQGRFLQNASHELKTPLMSIQGYAEAIMDGVIEDEKEALGTIVEESERLKRIVTNLSLLSKIETKAIQIEMKAFHFNTCVNDSLKGLQTLAEDSEIGIVLSIDKTEGVMYSGDRDSIVQVLINLVSNAIRYANSKVIIKTEIDSSMVEGPYIMIHIIDDGNGIREKIIPHIFERFYKGSNGQTGLGLAIVKAIVEMHDGDVLAENSPNLGAHFQIRLPIKNKNSNISHHML